MHNINHSEESVERLADEIRRLGTPYGSTEPDERYWMNFRVRVMDRIAEREQQKATCWTAIALGWIQDHILVVSLSTAAVLFAISLTLMLQPFQSDEPQKLAPQVAIITQPVAPSPVPPAPVLAENRSDKTDPPAKQPKADYTKPVAEQPSMASLDLPTENSSDAVAPVSLDELSAPELESVLNSLQTK